MRRDRRVFCALCDGRAAPLPLAGDSKAMRQLLHPGVTVFPSIELSPVRVDLTTRRLCTCAGTVLSVRKIWTLTCPYMRRILFRTRRGRVMNSISRKGSQQPLFHLLYTRATSRRHRLQLTLQDSWRWMTFPNSQGCALPTELRQMKRSVAWRPACLRATR